MGSASSRRMCCFSRQRNRATSAWRRDPEFPCSRDAIAEPVGATRPPLSRRGYTTKSLMLAQFGEDAEVLLGWTKAIRM